MVNMQAIVVKTKGKAVAEAPSHLPSKRVLDRLPVILIMEWNASNSYT